MVAVDDGGTFFGDVFFVDNADVSEEEMGGVPGEEIYT